jgi:hypothetical protein
MMGMIPHLLPCEYLPLEEIDAAVISQLKCLFGAQSAQLSAEISKLMKKFIEGPLNAPWMGQTRARYQLVSWAKIESRKIANQTPPKPLILAC